MEREKKKRIPQVFTQDDLAALTKIKLIAEAGDNVEVKKRDGKLTVYRVKKQIAQ